MNVNKYAIKHSKKIICSNCRIVIANDHFHWVLDMMLDLFTGLNAMLIIRLNNLFNIVTYYLKMLDYLLFLFCLNILIISCLFILINLFQKNTKNEYYLF